MHKQKHEVIRDYELASDIELTAWLARARERDGLVPIEGPALRVDDIGRTVLRFHLSPEHDTEP